MTSPFYVYSPSTFQEFKKMNAGVFSLLCTRFSIFQPLVLRSRSFRVSADARKATRRARLEKNIKGNDRVRVFIFRRRLRGACATSDGPGFRFRQRMSCISMRRYRSARCVWRMLVTSFFFWYLLLFRLGYNWNEPSVWTMLPVVSVSTFGCVILARNVYRTRD